MEQPVGKTNKSFESQKFTSPEEELMYLRARVAEKEHALEHVPAAEESAVLVEDTVQEYAKEKPEAVLHESYRMSKEVSDAVVLKLSPEVHDAQMEDFLGILQENGIKNVFEVLKKTNNPHLIDDFHRFLVQYVKASMDVPGLKKGSQTFNALHMKLYEIALPSGNTEETAKDFKELVSAMEQFYSGMLSIAESKDPIPGRDHFTIEIALANEQREVVFYVSVPGNKAGIFEKQIQAVFPDARLSEHRDDYNVFNETGVSVGAYGMFSRNAIYPIKTYDTFEVDPLNVILNVFSKIQERGEGAAIQITIAPAGGRFIKQYGYILDQVRKGVSVKNAKKAPTNIVGEFGKAFSDMFIGSKTAKKLGQEIASPQVDQLAVEEITRKIGTTIFDTNVRVIASAQTEARAAEISNELQSAFHQFSNTRGNSITFKNVTGKKILRFFQEFSYRVFSRDESLPLNTAELTTIMHFPVTGTGSAELKEARGKEIMAPMNIPRTGLLLGKNIYRGVQTDIYMTPEDRLRHFYCIGQTGTGKTTLLKNMIVQDIKNGEGVCMIDPHGNDLADILATIPKERMDDVIYFDPAYTARPMGLNMLEHDERFPEQKTFVVDELLSIFNKLFDMSVSGGPMFEQYFRNATLLVIGDPKTGNTLFEVSRVLADSAFRELKLSRCNNPIVVQFWREIAAKAGGEQSLQNMVPYVTNKFDVFLSNEIMRPIIGQERSAFNFRTVMDEGKILLVNLSKGRMGDINSHLLGLIIVGKILMAALSRVDVAGPRRPFYLYIDEFQNVTTDSIATILSEARKYGLSLTIAHQFIAQLTDNIKSAVFGNVGSLAAFRVGSTDAEYLEKQFAPEFSARDIMNLENRNAYMKILVQGTPVSPFNMATRAPERGNTEQIELVKNLSYQTYGRDRVEVEAEIMKKYQRNT